MSHARLAPSAAKRWMVCTGSPQLEDGKPRKSSIYAARGTCLHEIGEKALLRNTGVSQVAQPGQSFEVDGFTITVTEEDLAQVADYVDFVRATLRDAGEGAILEVEVKLDMSRFIPDGYGTSDTVIIVPFSHAIVIDAKFGSGIKVPADDPQLKCYGLAAWDAYADKYGLEGVETVVCQPPLKHVDMHTMDIDALIAWRGEVMPKAKAAHTGVGTELVPGDHCRFCLGKPDCSALRDQAMQKAQAAFAPSQEDPVQHALDIGHALSQIPAIEAWIADVKEQAMRALENGEPVEGYKLVEGRRSRAWKDSDKTEKYLRGMKVKVGDMMEQKLKSPAQMEKALKNRKNIDLSDHIEVKPGKPTMAPASDKRKALASRAETVFDNALLD